MWACFETDEAVHVVPCNDDSTVCAPHEIDEFCQCDPIISMVEGGFRLLVIHNDEQ